MATQKPITTKGNGKFSVREYIPNKAQSECPLIADGKQISALMTFRSENIPTELQPYAAEAREHTTEDGTILKTFKFKIGAFCSWFVRNEDGKAIPATRPTNAELDGRKFKVEVNWTHKDKNPTEPLTPSGFWANAILTAPMDALNPFEDEAPAAPVDVQPVSQQIPGAAAQAVEQLTDNADNDLPF